MGEVVRFPEISKEREKARLIQEARALYESVFPSEKRPEMMPSRPAQIDKQGFVGLQQIEPNHHALEGQPA